MIIAVPHQPKASQPKSVIVMIVHLLIAIAFIVRLAVMSLANYASMLVIKLIVRVRVRSNGN